MAVSGTAHDEAVEEQQEDIEDEIDGEPSLLGFVEKLEDSRILERQNFPSKLGGTPAWLNPVEIPREQSSCCEFCAKPLRFLLQVYSPRDGVHDAFHRTLFVFVCSSQDCLNLQKTEQESPECVKKCVKVFRNQLPRDNPFYSFDPPKEIGEPPLTPGAPLCAWCGTWRAGKRCGGCKKVGYCSREHQVSHWKAGHLDDCRRLQCGTESALEDLPKENENGPVPGAFEVGEAKILNQDEVAMTVKNSDVWPEFEIRVEEEESDDELIEAMADEAGVKLLREYEERKKGEGDYDDEEMAGFEEANIPEKRHWAGFQAKLGSAPQQILRYSQGEAARPLWPDLVGQPKPESIPLCKNCGSCLVFEFQVMPQALYYLKVDSSSSNALDFGTLAIFSCKNSCSSVSTKLGYVEEFVWIQ